MFSSATSEDISEFWSGILAIDATLKEDGRYMCNNITDYPSVLNLFLIVARWSTARLAF